MPKPHVVGQRRLQRCARTAWRWRKTLPKTNAERVRSVWGLPDLNIVSRRRPGTSRKFSLKRRAAAPSVVALFVAL